MAIQKISFQNKGQRIAADLHSADSDKLVILCHGFTGDKDSEGSSDAFPLLAKRLSEKGINALRIDFRGSGESEGRFEHMTISGEVSDLKIVLKEMGKKFRKIGVLGASLGGCVTILAYEKNMDFMSLWYPAVLPVDSDTGKFIRENLEEIRKKGRILRKSRNGKDFYIGKGLAEEWLKVNPTGKMDRIACPVLIVTGNKDKSCRLELIQEAFGKIRSPKQIHIVKGAGHGWKDSNGKVVREWKDEAIEATVNWFLKEEIFGQIA